MLSSEVACRVRLPRPTGDREAACRLALGKLPQQPRQPDLNPASSNYTAIEFSKIARTTNFVLFVV